MSFEKMLDSSDYSVEVSTDILCDKAVCIKKICEDITARINNIAKCIEQSSACWQSQTFDIVKEYYDEDKNDINHAVTLLNNINIRLQKIIDVYDFTEKQNSSDAESLTNTIFY